MSMTPPKPIFISDTLREAGLPLGTPLNRFKPDWPDLPPVRWMLRRDLKAAAETGNDDPMLPRYTRKCWCSECGAYFGSDELFTRHRFGGACMSFAAMRAKGWLQNGTGHWMRRKRPVSAGRADRGADNSSPPVVGSGSGDHGSGAAGA
jgi:hypothetical protein